MNKIIKFILLYTLLTIAIVLIAKDWIRENNDIRSKEFMTKIENSTNDSISYIKFVPNNVIDMIYYADDNSFIIEYDDCDVFDYDNMNYYNHYIEIFADKEIFYYIIDCIDNDVYESKNIFIKEEKIYDSDDYTYKFTLVYD